MTEQQDYKVRTPLFPGYSEVRKLLGIWNGEPKAKVTSMINSIWEQTGTPQDPVDWSSPDNWIDERLSGDDHDLAFKTWNGSDKSVNPRHAYGSYLFINTYDLLSVDGAGVYRLSADGTAFLEEDSEVVRAIDQMEGVPELLSILAARSPARRGDLMDDWKAFLLANSKYGKPSTIKDTLRRRILNLIERGFIDREGNTYTINPKGITYAAEAGGTLVDEPHQEVMLSVKAYNDSTIKGLKERLGNMDPYRFEALIKDLLEAMEYEDVVVTKQSGDKGVDVVANFQFGITQVKEVVQVKRHQASITRPVLDQLRGALIYHQAIRGTIITLGKFAKGAREAAVFPGAAPITLIDGDKLIDLLLTHEVAVEKRPLSLVEIDESYFEENAQETPIPSE